MKRLKTLLQQQLPQRLLLTPLKSQSLASKLVSKKSASSILTVREASDHILGSMLARATVIEYADFSCPSCLQAQGALKIISTQFDGQMRLVYRHFASHEQHPCAELAAEAVEAAGAQGKFWQMHDLLFKHQRHLSKDLLQTLAQQLDLDMARYHNDVQGHLYLQRVREHTADAHTLTLRATPTFFVNGERIDVSFGLDHLHKAVDAILALP
jgi:protein-disulfide isomerase